MIEPEDILSLLDLSIKDVSDGSIEAERILSQHWGNDRDAAKAAIMAAIVTERCRTADYARVRIAGWRDRNENK